MEKEKSFYEQTLSAIFKYIAGGALIVDKEARVLAINDALQKMTGRLPENVVGKKVCYALFGCRCQDSSGHRICWPGFRSPPSPESNGGYQMIRLVTAAGKKMEVRVTCAPLPNRGPESPIAIVLVQDNTECMGSGTAP
jgi:hypothetical protein